VAKNPALYWELLDLLPAGAFADAEAAEAWEQLAAAVEAEKTPEAPPWAPAADPRATARAVADKLQRRILAEALERLAAGLYSETPAAELAAVLEEEAARAQAAIRETQAGALTWAADLLGEVLADAEQRRRQREQTGKPTIGISTGLTRLDALLGGFETGLYIMAGGPGVGKTTFALQLAATATREVPVIYVTFENSPANMTLKALAARAGVNTQDVARGFADLNALRKAAEEWRPIGERLAMIEGTGRLTVEQVRAQAAESLRGMATVRERVEVMGNALRELAVRLNSPVLAIANQNRAVGDYGKGGAAALDSLKESGDLEYMVDVALFLTRDDKRHATPPARALTLTVAKNRHGDTGSVNLIFRPDRGRMAEEAAA
jgi:replicative DNA helicase